MLSKTAAQLLANTLLLFSSHSILPAKNTLNFSFRYLYFKNDSVVFFILPNFGKKDKMQLLAEFEYSLYIRLRATLTFRKLKVALNPMHRIFLNFAKSCILSCLSKFDREKNFHRAVFEI